MLGKYNTQNIMEIINDGDEIGFTLVIEALEDARSPTLYNADTDDICKSPERFLQATSLP